jgi:hypothetical protein
MFAIGGGPLTFAPGGAPALFAGGGGLARFAGGGGPEAGQKKQQSGLTLLVIALERAGDLINCT